VGEQTLIDLCWNASISGEFTVFWERLLCCLSIQFLNLLLDVSHPNVPYRM